MADEPTMSLKDAVLDGFAKAEADAGSVPAGETKVEETEPKVETKVEEKVEDKEDEILEVDASPEEIKNALSIVRALGNKETAGSTIEELARITGYDLGKKADQRAIVKDLKTIFREKLGDSYDLLSGDKLAEAMEAVVDSRVTEITKPVLDRITESERSANESKANAAMDSLWTRHEVTDKAQREKISGRMMEKMQKLPAGPGTDVNSYLDDIFSLVNRDTEASRTVKKTVTKIKQNAQDVSRTSGDGSSGSDETRVKTGSKLPSIREAVSAAFRGERLEE